MGSFSNNISAVIFTAMMAKDQDNDHSDDQDNDKESIDLTSDNTDKADGFFSNCYSPFFTSDESSRDAIRDYNWHIEGVEDPFYDSINKLYPGKGLQGYREVNIEQFKNISKRKVSLASQRYVKVDKDKGKIKMIITLIAVIVSFAFQPVLAPYTFPIFWGAAVWGIVWFILHIPELCRDLHDRKIFEARYQIGKELGLISKDFKDKSWKGYYKYDYGVEPPEEKK